MVRSPGENKTTGYKILTIPPSVTSSGYNVHPAITIMRLPDEWPTAEHTNVRESSLWNADVRARQHIYASVANPFAAASPSIQGRSIFAVAGTSTQWLISDAEGSWRHTGQANFTETRSISWLTMDLLAVGSRKNHIRLWDTRTNDSIVRFSAVGREIAFKDLRRLAAHKLVANSNRGVIRTYDLRMVQSGDRATQSIAQYSSPLHRAHGFDVNAELGIAAVADEDGSILLSSTASGSLLGTLEPSDDITVEGPFNCLKFASHLDGHEMLLGCAGERLVRWS